MISTGHLVHSLLLRDQSVFILRTEPTARRIIIIVVIVVNVDLPLTILIPSRKQQSHHRFPIFVHLLGPVLVDIHCKEISGCFRKIALFPSNNTTVLQIVHLFNLVFFEFFKRSHVHHEKAERDDALGVFFVQIDDFGHARLS